MANEYQSMEQMQQELGLGGFKTLAVQDTPAEETPAAEVAETAETVAPETSTEAPAETPEVGAEAGAEQPAEEVNSETPAETPEAEDAGTTEETPAEPEVEPNPYLTDYSTEAEASTETPAETPESTPESTTNVLSLINEGIGSEYSSVEQFNNEMASLKEFKTILENEGITPDLLEAVKNNEILFEELVSGQSMVEIQNLHDDDMAREKLGQMNPGASAEELDSMIEDMDPHVKALYAQNRRDELASNRQKHFNALDQKRLSAAQKRDIQEKKREAILGKRQEGINAVVGKIKSAESPSEKYIAGTTLEMNDQMLNTAARVMMNPIELQKAVFKSLENPNYGHALHQVMRLLYPGSIAKNQEQTIAAKNTSKIIEEHQNVQVGGNTSQSLASTKPVSRRQALQAEWDRQFKS